MKPQEDRYHNIILRILSAMVIGAIFITSILWLRSIFYCVLTVVGALMLLEWYKITYSSWLDLLIGVIIIPSSISSIALLSFFDENGWLLLTYFTTIWSVDIFAMIFGKNIGGTKLAPVISPHKTVSGLIGGVITATIIVYAIQFIPFYQLPYFYSQENKFIIAFGALIIGFISQYSDLFVSIFKRKFHVKDSGNIIPGHGGMLDRFDSFLLTAPILALWTLVKYLNFA
jgi:phosphatidate cytidylyltransferase